MNKYIITLILLTSFMFTSWQSYSQNTKEQIWVNGVCEMCQKRIQKAALKVKGVKYASWDIELKELTLIYNKKKCSIAEIKQKIASVGHDTEGYKALDDIYQSLHYCCKYEREE